jgi:hypothetical protein
VVVSSLNQEVDARGTLEKEAANQVLVVFPALGYLQRAPASGNGCVIFHNESRFTTKWSAILIYVEALS